MDAVVSPTDQGQILVEFVPRAGLQEVARLSPEDIARRSSQAIDAAMATVREMALRVTSSVEPLVDRPSQIEVQFGIKLDIEAGALIAKVGSEASLNIKLTWVRQEKRDDDDRP